MSFGDSQAHWKIWAAFGESDQINSHMMEC